MIIVQLSDPHVCLPGSKILGHIDTSNMLNDAVQQVLALIPAPDAVIITGDLTHTGSIGEYKQLRKLLEPLLDKLYLVPGNHDNLDSMRSVFQDQSYLNNGEKKIYYTEDIFPLRLIGMDSVVEGEEYGEFCKKQLQWLDEILSSNMQPSLLFFHHPPFHSGIISLDVIGCRNGAELLDVIGGKPQVKGILCGHQHRVMATQYHNVLSLICPSTAHQIKFDFSGQQTYSAALEPPGFFFHFWDGENLTSHLLSSQVN